MIFLVIALVLFTLLTSSLLMICSIDGALYPKRQLMFLKFSLSLIGPIILMIMMCIVNAFIITVNLWTIPIVVILSFYISWKINFVI